MIVYLDSIYSCCFILDVISYIIHFSISIMFRATSYIALDSKKMCMLKLPAFHFK